MDPMGWESKYIDPFIWKIIMVMVVMDWRDKISPKSQSDQNLSSSVPSLYFLNWRNGMESQMEQLCFDRRFFEMCLKKRSTLPGN